MNHNKNKEISINLYNSIFELLKTDESEVRDTLEVLDIDINKLDNENLNFIRDLLTKARIDIGKEKAKEKESIFEKAKIMLKNISNIDIFLSQNLSKTEYEQLSLEFRNLEYLDKETKIDLLNEMQLLKLMEILKEKTENE
jgi:hypothetical protein